jgi:imidazolonepropionase-like amidohydrolase
LDGSPPSFQPSIVVTSPAQAAAAVQQLAARHVDFIKVQSMLNRESYFAIAKAAHDKNMSFAGHVPDVVTAAEAANAGQRSIEHLTDILRACSQEEPALMREQFRLASSRENAVQSHQRLFQWLRELLASYSPDAANRLFAILKQHDVWQTPTLILLQQDAFPTVDNNAASDVRTASIPFRTLENWKKARIAQMDSVVPHDSELRAQLFAKSMNIVREMKNHGLNLLVGTDSPAPYVFPGSSLHEELWLLVQAGLTPIEALQAATVRPAEFLHIANDYGTVEAGKYADLVLLDGNPLVDIHNSGKIWAVILHGKLLDRAYLDRSLKDEQAFAAHNAN